MGNNTAIPLIVFALAATSSTGCSRGKSIDRDQLRSEMRSARSFAAESETFVDFVLQGRATRHYAEAHAAYLHDELEQTAKELETAVAESDVADSISACRMQINQVIRQLSEIRAALGDRNRLVAGRAKMKQIRESLEKANPYL